jgi:hypothetical protein
MVLTPPVSHNSSEYDITSSPDAGTRRITAAKLASSNGRSSHPSTRYTPADEVSENSVCSRMSSPREHSRRDSDHPSQGQPGMFPQVDRQEQSGHKRKRSDLDDPLAYGEQRTHDYSASMRPEPQHMANRALHVLGNGSHNAPLYYQNGTEQHNGHTWHPEGPVQSQAPTNGVRPNTSEAQMAEVLQRETSVSEAPSRSWESQPTTNGQTASDQYGHEPITPPAMVAMKRKRNFSNRTKTGCLTCRTRKKKCDEARPRCEFCHPLVPIAIVGTHGSI